MFCGKCYNLLLLQILLNQNLQQLVTVDLADEGAGVVVVGNVSGILGEDVTNDLVDGIVALFLQCVINGGEDQADLGIFIHFDSEFTGKIFHFVTTFHLSEEIKYHMYYNPIFNLCKAFPGKSEEISKTLPTQMKNAGKR